MKNSIPISIGVTGHRDVIVSEHGVKLINDFFVGLTKNYPNSPILLFSPLADGADRIVAKVLLKLKEKEPDKYLLIVPLPFQLDEYKKDFSEESVKEFEELISHAERYFAIKGKIQSLSDAYKNVGKFVSDSSLILLALWNGEFNNQNGGTSDIIDYRRTQHNNNMFVYYCKRESSKTLKKDSNLLELSSQNVLNNTIRKNIENIEKINIDSQCLDQFLICNSKEKFINDYKSIDKKNQKLLHYYGILDALTENNTNKIKKIRRYLFLLSGIILFFFESYKHLGLNRILLFLTIIVLFSTTIYHYLNKKKEYHKKHLEYRVLSEALRVQFFWNIARLNTDTAKFILKIHQKEYQWINNILFTIYGSVYRCEDTSKDNLEFVFKNWIEDQINWFPVKIKGFKKEILKYSFWSKWTFITAIIVLLTIVLFEHYYENTYWLSNIPETNFFSFLNQSLLEYVIIVIGMLFGISALFAAFLEIKGSKQLLNQYNLMLHNYKNAAEKIKPILDKEVLNEEQISEIKSIIFELGKDSLIENGNWYIINKEREPEPHTP